MRRSPASGGGVAPGATIRARGALTGAVGTRTAPSDPVNSAGRPDAAGHDPVGLPPGAVAAVLDTAVAEDPDTAVCPGCGAVLAVVPPLTTDHPGASPSCAGLFDVTVRGLRDEARADLRTAAVLQLARDAYDAQHQVAGQPAAAAAALCLWVTRGLDPVREREVGARLADTAPTALTPPDRWTTTVADVAADLDVVDLPSLVRSWAEAVWRDWHGSHPELCAAADRAQRLPG
jgi:hypothetical protein